MGQNGEQGAKKAEMRRGERCAEEEGLREEEWEGGKRAQGEQKSEEGERAERGKGETTRRIVQASFADSASFGSSAQNRDTRGAPRPPTEPLPHRLPQVMTRLPERGIRHVSPLSCGWS